MARDSTSRRPERFGPSPGRGRARIARLPYHASRLNTAHRTLTAGFVIDRWQPARGGAERALASLAARLERSGHRALAFAERGPGPEVDAPGRVHHVRASPFAWTRGARTRSLGEAGVAAARAAGCDVTIGVRHLRSVDLYWPHGGSHARSVAAVRAARAWRPDRPAGIEPVEPTGRHREYVALERELLEGDSGLRRVVCVSDLVHRELAEDFPRCRRSLVTVPNGVDLERFHPREKPRTGARLRARLAVSPGDVVLAFAAREPVTKGLPVLLSALSRLRGAPWVLVAAGMDDAEAWRARAVSAGLDARRVRCVPEIDTAALFAAADVTVLPTWRDTGGLVILESLAAGTPVVTTSVAGEAGAIDEDSGTVLDRPGDATALVEALASWFDRVRVGDVEPALVRARVAHRDEDVWLDRLERIVGEVAAEIAR